MVRRFPKPLSIVGVAEVLLSPNRNAPALRHLTHLSCSMEQETAQSRANGSSPTTPACHLLLIHPCNKVFPAFEKSPESLIKDYLGTYSNRESRTEHRKGIQGKHECWQKGHCSSWCDPPRRAQHRHQRGTSVRRELKQPCRNMHIASGQEEAHLPKKGSIGWKIPQPWGVLCFLSGFVFLTQIPPTVLGSFSAA